MSPFIESIRIQNYKAHLLDLHQKRVNTTLTKWEAKAWLNLEQIVRNLDIQEAGLFKLRIVYDIEGNYSTRLVPYVFNKIESFELVQDNLIDYTYKYENRKALDALKKQAKATEIVIVKNNCITDTSFSNLIFKKEEEWYTPSTYLLNGVQRQNLLHEGIIKEAEITPENLEQFSHFRLINAMNPFNQGFTYPTEMLIKRKPAEEFYL